MLGFLSEHTPAIMPEIFLGIIAMVLLLVGVLGREDNSRRVTYSSILALIATSILAADVAPFDQLDNPNLYLSNGFTQFCKVAVLLFTAATLLLTVRQLELEQISRFEYPVLTLLASLGMMVVISSNDLMSLFMGIELTSLPLYVLVAIRRDETRSGEAAIKYFILGSLSSALYLYGTSLVYGVTGGTDFLGILSTLKHGNQHQALMMTAIGLILAGLAFKITLAPFHMWAPDVYEGAPTPVVVILSVAPKLAVFAALARLLGEALLPFQAMWSNFIAVFALTSMLIGAFAALNQNNIKRLLAYSTVAHMGYASLALLAPSSKSIAQLVVYLVIYGVTVLAAFGCILSLRHHGKTLEDIHDYQGLGREHPRIAAALAIIFFSLAGIPPLAGFFAKLGLFMTAVNAGYGWLVILAVLTSVVAAGYYLRLLRVVYFDVAQEKALKPIRIDTKVYHETAYVTAAAVVLLVVYALWPQALVERAEAAAATLFVKT